MKKTIVILANSVKHGQHCVAGKDIITKQWIRPVNGVKGSELTHEQAKCQNPHGVFPISVLQKIEMSFSQAAPLINQPENCIITDDVWLQKYKIERNDLIHYLDNPKSLWSNESSSGNGQYDRVAHYQILSRSVLIEQSLYLIRLDEIEVVVTTNIENKKRIRVSFFYNSIAYNLATTDPVLWKDFSNKAIGNYQFDTEKFLCISLGGRFDDGFCYKLVAAVL